MISKCTEELEKNPALLEKAKRAQDVTSDGLLSPNSVKTIWVSYVDGKRTSLLPVLCMPGASVLCTFSMAAIPLGPSRPSRRDVEFIVAANTLALLGSELDEPHSAAVPSILWAVLW